MILDGFGIDVDNERKAPRQKVESFGIRAYKLSKAEIKKCLGGITYPESADDKLKLAVWAFDLSKGWPH